MQDQQYVAAQVLANTHLIRSTITEIASVPISHEEFYRGPVGWQRSVQVR